MNWDEYFDAYNYETCDYCVQSINTGGDKLEMTDDDCR